MKIVINQTEITYQLENERVLGDLLPSVQQYLFNSGQLVYDVHIDGIPMNAGDYTKNIEDIQLVEIVSGDILEIEECMTRCKNLLQRLESGQGCDLQKCGDNITLWAKSCEFWLQDFSLPADLFQTLFRLPSLSSDEDPTLYTKTLSIMLRCLEERDRELEDPIRMTLESMQGLVEKEGSLRDLGVNLQANQDATSVYEILLFMESLQKLKRVIQLLPESLDSLHHEVYAWVEQISQQLAALVEAFDQKDFVLVADLAEYEVAERLGALQEVITRYTPLMEHRE
ncbi:hypothetical protein PVA45_02830 [Entomospira entomophila]|uniref:Uncharacterized protein n=1 Tax=Entomospira entomophila TaxID=2719988 RepID=A0A968GCK2_9SPIO|nr:hypothetical protein [Entomospira entomophilus]NIZ40449.1 hypothetical protein [Entomospira entomophilus]WDI36007.1 hypothetical protein PVA45_02830 [Entomospira entomophilus]